jgi:hypothetical protein
MNRLEYDVTRDEVMKISEESPLNIRVNTDTSYTFGDVLNILTNGGYNKLFIRDDYYLTHRDIYIGLDVRSFTFRSLVQTTSFDDDMRKFTEAFIPTTEDLLEHVWYEYIPE